jgi:creatinine amidohydrolase
MSTKVLLHEMTWPEAHEAFRRTPVVLIPTGSTEQHGPHLPLGTDFLVAEDLARRIAQRADVIVTPTLPIGYAQYHTEFPGTLSLSEDTLTRALIEICDNLVKYGASHILFINGHGGNMPSITRCGEALRERCVPMAAACWWKMSQVVNPEWLATGHGDYLETSVVLAINDALPRMELARLPRNKPLSEALTLDAPDAARFGEGTVFVNLVSIDTTDSGDMLEIGLTGASDYQIPPGAATREMGEALLDGLADYMAAFIAEFRKVTLQPLDRLGPLARDGA